MAVSLEYILKLSGFYWRGQRNAARVAVRHNRIQTALLPEELSGFTILQLSDLHADISERAIQHVASLLDEILTYDICVLTGDYRGQTYGPFDETLAAVGELAKRFKAPAYCVLGNHDTIRMVPGLEQLGIRVLINESEMIERRGKRLHLVGVDDAHFFRADNIEKAALEIPNDEFSILLSHTPEIYRQAAHADFNLMLAGHTHGGQICLPGGFPVILDAVLPRRYGSGAWRHRGMHGYTSKGMGTSVVPVRFNCTPEITLHHLLRET